MQQFVNIASTETLTNSRAEIVNNDLTILSCSSGSSFPTTNIEQGMLCLRTDLMKLFQLKDMTPTWVMIFDLAKTATSQEYVDNGLGTKVNKNGDVITGSLNIQGELIQAFSRGRFVVDSSNNFWFRASADDSDTAVGICRNGVKDYSLMINKGGAAYTVYHTGNIPAPATSAAANTLVQRDVNGYLYSSYLNISNGQENSTAVNYLYDSGDGFIRKKAISNVKSELGIPSTFSGNTMYTIAGTYTWTSPITGTVYVSLIGGGGGGGAGASGSGCYGGAGGSSGDARIMVPVPVTWGQQVTVTVGAGGLGGAANQKPGSTGGTSSFGPYISAPGGLGGGQGVYNQTSTPGAPIGSLSYSGVGSNNQNGGNGGPSFFTGIVAAGATSSAAPGGRGQYGASGAGGHGNSLSLGGQGGDGVVIIMW